MLRVQIQAWTVGECPGTNEADARLQMPAHQFKAPDTPNLRMLSTLSTSSRSTALH